MNLSKCMGNSCLIRDTCSRYLTPADDLYPNWLVGKYDKERGTCWDYRAVFSSLIKVEVKK